MTITDVSALTGLAAVSISNLEKNRRTASIPTLRKLTKALDVTASFIGCFEKLPEASITEKIKKARYYHCLTRDEMANRIGVNPRTIFDKLDATVKDLYGFGGDWAVLSVGDWLNIEILIHPDGYVGDMYLDATPTTDEQGIDLISMITALIAGVTGYDTDRAFDVAIKDLGLEQLDTGFHLEVFETDNSAIRVYGDAYGWEISVEPHRN